MRKFVKSFLAVCMAAVMLAPMSVYAYDTANTTIYVNGSSVLTPVIMQDGRQMVPAAFFRNLKLNVTWNEQYRAAVINNKTVMIGFPASKKYADFDLQGLNNWHRDYLYTTTVNHGGRIYIPLAYTARKLGLEVTYNPRSKRTTIIEASRAGILNQTYANNNSNHVSASQEDMKWLYQITEAEAGGESYQGKVAVAASILNRVSSPEWPGSIQDTIFQVTTFNGKSYYQYSPVLDKRIYRVTPSVETKRAVQAAINGEDPGKGATVFYNPDKTDNQWVRSRETTAKIGNHIFAK
ncbi:cell wall hydrolase [Paenibacillus tarimensis]